MKETLEYYYNLDIDTIEELDGKYHVKVENQDFFFVFYNRGIEELEDIINVCNEMILKGINVHEVIRNRNNSYLTKVNEYDYILFKVSNMMEEYDKVFPEYGFASNKGYGSADHIAALKKYGETPIHRKTFITHFI